MRGLLRWFVWALARSILALRYRVRVRGLETVRGVKGPFLILPNHPGFIDPPVVLTWLWPYLRPRPMLYEGNFRGPVLRLIPPLLDAALVPDLDRPSEQAQEQARRAVAAAIDGLRHGHNQILWPAGTVQRDGVERLGAAQAAGEILQAVPAAEVVLVRTRGLWGSSFGWAYTGKRPDLNGRLRAGIGWLLANLLLFTPRRLVEITVEHVDRSQLPAERDALNRRLEAWYNAPGPEAPTFVPYHFLLGPRSHEYPPAPTRAEVDPAQIKPATKAGVAQVLEEMGHPAAPEQQRPETALAELGLSSIDAARVSQAVEQRFGFTGDVIPLTLGELWALAQGLAEKAPVKPPPPEWFRSPTHEGLLRIDGDTVAEALVARATYNTCPGTVADPQGVAVADDFAGVLTYEKLLIGSLLLARRFAALPGANVGLMLPASVACDMAFLALHLAGKLPVLLNWTTGPANLDHAAWLMNLGHVITSHAFIDRFGIAVEGTSYVFLEDLFARVGRLEKLTTLLRLRLLPHSVSNRLPRVEPGQPAVVLFTSGSEKAPKAVPLTHANLLCEMRAGIPFFGLKHEDILLSFLPPFHSFGLAVGMLLPILGGMKVVHHPDPTDGRGLARKVAAYKPTLLVGTPTFVNYLLDRAEPGQLDSLRLIVVGAEKCTEALYERVKRSAPHAQLVEGYGITECSPVVSVNRPGASRPGTVGQPLPGVEVRVVDLETKEPLPPGRQGMLWVSGPTVFPGYLGDEPPPFEERDGKRWYVTGDLATLDDDGYIHLAGRLKRFLKAGGEMISLPALEEPLARRWPPTDEGPRVAVEGVETPEGRRIALFTTQPVTLREANALLYEEGFRGVMRLDEVRRVEKVPVLGTGKTDYKELRKRLME